MAVLDWSQCSAVESIPGKVSGAWLFKGTRTPVATVFENLEDGMTIDEMLEQFPVTRDQVKAVLEFAADEERRALDAALSKSWESAEAGRVRPASQVIDELRQRR